MVDHSSENPAVNEVNPDSTVFAVFCASSADSAAIAVTAELCDNQAVT
jgi:hypothetical protein